MILQLWELEYNYIWKKVKNLKTLKIIFTPLDNYFISSIFFKRLFLTGLIIIFFLIYGTDIIIAQNTKLDSLWKVYKIAKHDSTRIKLLIDEIGYLYESINPDSAIMFYNKAIELADKNLKPQALNVNKFLNYKAYSLRYIGIVYSISGNYSKAIEYYLRALNISEKLNNKNGMSACYGNLGIVNMNQGNYNIAIEYFLKSLKIDEEINDKKGTATCYNNIGSVYYSKGSYPKAIEYYLKALKIDDDLNDKVGMYLCLNNIGNVHAEQGNNSVAIEYYIKSLKIAETLDDKNGMSNCYGNIGSVNYSQGNYSKAIEYFLKALKIKELFNDKNGIYLCLNNIGDVYNDQGIYNKAIEYYLKSLKIVEEINDKNGMAMIYDNIAKLNISLSDSAALNKTQRMNYLNKVIIFGTKSIDLANEINALPWKCSAANTLMKAYKKLGNFKKSIEYAEIYIATKDSMFSEEKTKSLAEMGAKYESEKRELTIQKLEKEQLLQNETIARKNAESKKQRILIFSFLAGFIIILVFSIFLYRLFIQKKKANIILSQQKEEISAQRDEIETQRDLVTEQKEHIEEIHKEVTDSINYAERIQRSFLATKKLLDENLNEHFVFFHPKDVVSGDFYWVGKLNNGNFAIVTADSTGHGVPGAIMSILNISSLEKAIESGICEPSEILNHTRKTIIERLKKDGSPDGGKDGMDASLISFDFENKKLTYSAANNAIWIVRSSKNLTGFQNLSGLEDENCHVKTLDKGNSADFQNFQNLENLEEHTNQRFVLHELIPDKMPIGKHDKDQISFTQHEFQLQKDDVIYTLTDGFPDQFGGSKGKKFMSKNLKELIIANCLLTMEEQKEMLEKTLVEWIGEGEQIDDITIIGIRV